MKITNAKKATEALKKCYGKFTVGHLYVDYETGEVSMTANDVFKEYEHYLSIEGKPMIELALAQDGKVVVPWSMDLVPLDTVTWRKVAAAARERVETHYWYEEQKKAGR